MKEILNFLDIIAKKTYFTNTTPKPISPCYYTKTE